MISSGSVRLRQLLITGEVALTVVLLAGAGLMVRTLVHLQTLPPGFNPSGIITAKASLDDIHYHDPATFRKLLNESLASMRNIPGVENVAVGLALPYERSVITGVTVAQGGNAAREFQPMTCMSRLLTSPRYRSQCWMAVHSPMAMGLMRSPSSSSTRHSLADFFLAWIRSGNILWETKRIS
jgi:hypothetical protein